MAEDFQFDQDMADRIEAIYVTPDVSATREEVLRILAITAGERVLDIGCGTGLLTVALADAVGSTGQVHGIDLSESMLARARPRCVSRPWVEFHLEEATHLPFPDGTFDVGVATQVYEYVSDLMTALRELYRVLRPGGRALVLDTDLDSIIWHSTDSERMDRVLAAWNDHVVDPHLPRTLGPKLVQAGFQIQHRRVIPILNTTYSQDSFSFHESKLIRNFVVDRGSMTTDETDTWLAELEQRDQAGEYFFSVSYPTLKSWALPWRCNRVASG